MKFEEFKKREKRREALENRRARLAMKTVNISIILSLGFMITYVLYKVITYLP